MTIYYEIPTDKKRITRVVNSIKCTGNKCTHSTRVFIATKQTTQLPNSPIVCLIVYEFIENTSFEENCQNGTAHNYREILRVSIEKQPLNII